MPADSTSGIPAAPIAVSCDRCGQPTPSTPGAETDWCDRCAGKVEAYAEGARMVALDLFATAAERGLQFGVSHDDLHRIVDEFPEGFGPDFNQFASRDLFDPDDEEEEAA